ncbi:hypothetical protein BB559_007181 [Furculomyces boomerangus]|uniref:PFU domain-containing protein n=1 Tax=Furculomyces boomerangus TaxID=61424 RepID=A0A2T9XYJ7_9FUNG|nr:hypothetical protein BB559_007181 [Furculomyces boomerangus]
MFKLSATLSGHHDDIKGVANLSDDSIVTVSRDKTGGVWERQGTVNFSLEKMLISHNGYVNSVSVLEIHNNSYIVTGGSDKIIYVWDSMDCSEPIYSLIGHEENVCVLAALKNGGIVSGSWDKTAKVWIDYQCVYTLKGHSSAIWAVSQLEDGTILTGSADRTICQWNGEKLIKTYKGHEDCVRALVPLSENKFASASNDGSIRIWDTQGNCLSNLYGHDSFIYALGVLPSNELVSSSEDRTIKIWKNNENIQTIILPATSIWCLSILKNGDIVCGTSNNNAYIFTRDQARLADIDTLNSFNEANAKFSESKKIKDKLDTERLPGPERLLQPGTKDQQIIMVRQGVEVEAHQWDANSSSWLKVGVVTDAVGQERKQLFEGKEYDYVFSVDLEDGLPNKKLPYNSSENPYNAAQNFINRNEISQTYLDQIASFIIQNTGGAQLGQGNKDLDPFTGQNKYIPGTEASSNYENPINKKNESSTLTHQGFSFPKNYVLMVSANTSAIINKFSEFNNQVGEEFKGLELANGETQCIKDLSTFLAKKDNEITDHINPKLDILVNTLKSWPEKYRFPLLDLLRLLVARNMSEETLINHIQQGESLYNFISDITKLPDALKPNMKNDQQLQVRITMGVRMLANMISHKPGRNQVVLSSKKLLEVFMEMANGSMNKSMALAVSTFLLNFAIMVYRAKNLLDESPIYPTDFGVNQCCDTLLSISKKLIENEIELCEKSNFKSSNELNSDALIRLVSIFGVLLLTDKERTRIFIKNEGMVDILNKLPKIDPSSQLSNACGLALSLAI